jgi:hypothetical protein
MTTHRLRHRLLSVAHTILGTVQRPPDEPVSVEVAEDGVRVSIRLHRCQDDPAPGRARIPGRHLSSAEALIWECLGADSLQGKQVAVRIGMEYGPRVKVLLANLVDRGVLNHEDGDGYSRATDH